MDDRESERHGGVAPLVGWLIHPVTIAAVVVLAVNDHLLKARYPGLLTGKLSDLAGLVVLPPLLALVLVPVLPRRSSAAAARTALVVTAACFAMVKATPAGAELASALWSLVSGPSMVLADRTDLVALPAVAVAAWAWTRARRRPPSSARLRRIEVLVVLPAAAVALAATTAPHYPDAVAVGTWRGMIVAGEGNAYHGDREPDRWRLSGDGRVWRRMTPTEESAFEKEGLRQDYRARQTCVPDEAARCYRIVPGHLRVLESADGGVTWSTSWEVPDGRRAYLARLHTALRPSDVDAYLSAQAIAVLPVTGHRHVVVVANGREGFAVRDASGRWDRVGFGIDASGYRRSAEPLSGDRRVIAPEAALSILVGMLVVGVGAWRICGDGGRDVDGASTSVIAGLLVGLSGAAGLAAADDLLGLAGLPAVVVGIVLTVCGVAVLMRVAARASMRPRWLPLMVLAGLSTTGVMIATFGAWTEGLLVDYRSATIMALLVAFIGTSASVSIAGLATPAGGRWRVPLHQPPPANPTTVRPVSPPEPEPAASSPPVALPPSRLRPARPPEESEGIGRSDGAVRGSD